MARKVTVHLIGDSDSLERAFDRAGKKGKEFETRTSRMGSSLKTLGKAGAAGIAVGGVALVTSTIVKGVAAAKEAQLAQARMRQALKASGISHRRYGKEIDATIDKTSRLAGLDDEELSEAFSKLVRTTGSVTKATEGMALAADIARARNISLESATKTVERAMNGNLLSLKRVGVQLDKNTTASEAIDRAQKKFAGSAEAYGKTAAGAQERFAVALENLQERIGAKLLPVLTKLALWGVRFLDWSEKNWPKFSRVVSEQWEKIRPVFEAFKSYFGGFVKIIQGIITGDWSLAWKGVKQSVSAGFDLLFAWFKAIPARFFAWGVKMGKRLADGVIAGIGNLVDRITDKLPFANDSGFQKEIDKAKQKVRDRSGSAPVVSTTSPPAGGAARHPGRARGGPVMAGKTYAVGERGKEWLTMGSSSGFVSPANSSSAAPSGDIVIVLDGSEISRHSISHQQRMARSTNAQRRGVNPGTKFATT